MTCAGRLVRIDDCSLWVDERGASDGFPVIVVHGGPGLDHHIYGDYLDPLTEHGLRLLFFDLRGDGRSERPPQDTWTLERHAQDVIMLALALRLDRYAVLGHSFGAFVALQNAVDYPGQAAATVVSAGIPSLRWMEQMGDRLEELAPEIRTQVEAAWDLGAGPQATDDELVRSLYGQLPFHFRDPLDPRIQEFERRTSGLLGSAAAAHLSEANGPGIDVEDRLPAVTQHVLLLAGRHDATCPAAAAEHMAMLLPNNELRIFEDSGHMAYVEEDRAYLDAVASFLSSIRQT